MAQALAGSQSAFEQILRRYQRPILSLLVRLTGDPALAEDLAQETFVKAFRNLAAFDSKRRLSSWLFRIAHNTGIDALRKSRPVTVDLDAGEPFAELAAPAAADPVERYESGLSFEEIGHVLGIPESTARSHVHRARKDLVRAMTAAGWTPGR